MSRSLLAALDRQSARWLNAALMALTALAMVFVVVLAIRTIEAERALREQARLTGEILNELRDISRAALSAETGQRGFLLTLDRRYLAPYFAGRDQIGPSRANLRRLVEPRATARQRELIDEIDVLARSKFSELKRSIELVEAGDLIEARRLILTDEGQETMERLRGSVREMETIEFAILIKAQEDAARAEGRVIPLLIGLLGLLAISLVASGRLIARSARAEAEAAQAQALAEARDRADLLARELNHRVKNLFAVILAIVKLSARSAPEAKSFADTVAERIQALLKAHDVSQGEIGRPSVALGELIETSLAPYRSPDLTATLDGPEVVLDGRSITPIGLVLHEMTTNAVKYGGWSRPGGSIAVEWRRDNGMVELVWREIGAVPLAATGDPERMGFGSQLMSSSARQLGGSVERRLTPEGAVITMRFPVPA